MSKGMKWTEQDLAEFQRRTQKKPGEKVGEMLANQQAARTLASVPAKPNKYRNEKVRIDGIVHDSKKEARRWKQLQEMEQAGQIASLKRQVAFELAPSVKFKGDPRAKPALRFIADFVYEQNGEKVVEDVKSPTTRKLPAYRIKKHLLLSGLGLEINEI